MVDIRSQIKWIAFEIKIKIEHIVCSKRTLNVQNVQNCFYKYPFMKYQLYVLLTNQYQIKCRTNYLYKMFLSRKNKTIYQYDLWQKWRNSDLKKTDVRLETLHSHWQLDQNMLFQNQSTYFFFLPIQGSFKKIVKIK